VNALRRDAALKGVIGLANKSTTKAWARDRTRLNHLELGRIPFHTIIPAMVFKDNQLFMSFGVMDGGIQG
jgi:gamma-glutamyltranspeptidase / glutathione hydrolase